MVAFSFVSAQDSSSKIAKKQKPSKAPVIAFAVIGASVGIAIGVLVDPAEQNKIPGEMHCDFSTGGTVGLILGTAIGGYIGHRLAKRDFRRAEEREKKRHQSQDSTSTISIPDSVGVAYQLAAHLLFLPQTVM